MAKVNLHFNAFRHNINMLKSKIHPQTLSIGLKDNAYGHGIEEIEEKCLELNVFDCFVRNFQEAKRLKIPKWQNILVLAPYPKELVNDEFWGESLSFTLSDFSELEYLDGRYKFEIELNVGMNRNGFAPSEVSLLIKILKERKLVPFGVYTHLHVCIENEPFAIDRIQLAEELFNLFKLEFPEIRRHFANTDTALTLTKFKADICRVGIGCYGYTSNMVMKPKLMPVMEVVGHRQKHRFCNTGDHVGYGYQAYVVESDNYEVSVYDIGYADFRCRFNEHKAFEVESGGLVCGRVSMDSMMVASGLEEISIFRDAEKISDYFETIPYEILVSVSNTLLRQWVYE